SRHGAVPGATRAGVPSTRPRWRTGAGAGCCPRATPATGCGTWPPRACRGSRPSGAVRRQVAVERGMEVADAALLVAPEGGARSHRRPQPALDPPERRSVLVEHPAEDAELRRIRPALVRAEVPRRRGR